MSDDKVAARPWGIGETRHGYDIVIRDAKNYPVAMVYIPGWSKGMPRANAELIVAAVNAHDPSKVMVSRELLDKLLVATRSAREELYMWHMDSECRACPTCTETLPLLREALALAAKENVTKENRNCPPCGTRRT